MAVQPENVFLQIQDKIFTAKSAKKKTILQQESGELDTDPLAGFCFSMWVTQ